MKYKTEQKNILYPFLNEHQNEQYTIHDLLAIFEGEQRIGESTIYRLMSELVREGMVRRFSIGSQRTVYYQYIAQELCQHHLHLKCKICGKLIHLNGMVSEFMMKQIQANHHFQLDEKETLLFGICQTCQKGQ